MIKIIIIHGNGGCTAEHFWYSAVARELEKMGLSVTVPTMPDNVEAKASIWLPYMKNSLKCNENTIIVGHSSGAVAAMRYAERYSLLGTILVAPCYTDLGFESERLSGYYDTPWQWDTIKENQQWIAQLASSDDPHIPIDQAQYINRKLGTEYFEFSNEGHFTKKVIPGVISIITSKL